MTSTFFPNQESRTGGNVHTSTCEENRQCGPIPGQTEFRKVYEGDQPVEASKAVPRDDTNHTEPSSPNLSVPSPELTNASLLTSRVLDTPSVRAGINQPYDHTEYDVDDFYQDMSMRKLITMGYQGDPANPATTVEGWGVDDSVLQVQSFLEDEQNRQIVSQMKGYEAQRWLDLLQEFAEDSGCSRQTRARIYKVMLRFSKASGMIPECLMLLGDVKREYLVAGGGFEDVFGGRVVEQTARSTAVQNLGDHPVPDGGLGSLDLRQSQPATSTTAPTSYTNPQDRSHRPYYHGDPTSATAQDDTGSANSFDSQSQEGDSVTTHSYTNWNHNGDNFEQCTVGRTSRDTYNMEGSYNIERRIGFSAIVFPQSPIFATTEPHYISPPLTKFSLPHFTFTISSVCVIALVSVLPHYLLLLSRSSHLISDPRYVASLPAAT
ncbi:Rho guanine nucleotide exchange factor [Marasmius sp. AFHP31]|nr:Rho guanine nucleotide exchange factor [Marasmius sp. AFHP31]